jgi:hypothetical protein
MIMKKLFFLLTVGFFFNLVVFAQMETKPIYLFDEVSKSQDVPEFVTVHNVWKVDANSGYLNQWTKEGPVLRQVNYYPKSFNLNYDPVLGTWYRYEWGLSGHDGRFFIGEDIDSPTDTIDLRSLGYDETGPHNFLGTSDSTVWLVAKKIDTVSSMLYSNLPYINGDDSITENTRMRYEYLVRYNFSKDSVDREIPIWQYAEPAKIDWTQNRGSGEVSLLLGLHVNALRGFVDTDGVVTGIPGAFVFAVLSKTMNRVIFIDIDGNYIGETDETLNFNFTFYETRPEYRVNPLNVVHGLCNVEYIGNGRLRYNILNNNATGNFAEALTYLADFNTELYARVKVFRKTGASSERLGNYTDIDNLYSYVNWGAPIDTDIPKMSILRGVTEIAEYDIPTVGSEAFAINKIDSVVLPAQPLVTLDSIAGVPYLTVHEEASWYGFLSEDGDSLIITDENRWKAPTGLSGYQWVAGVGNASKNQFVFGQVQKTTSVEQPQIEVSKRQILLFPNPVTSQMRLEGFAREATLYITDMGGRTVYGEQVFPGQRVNLAHLAAGQYIATVIEEGVTSQKRFIKK